MTPETETRDFLFEIGCEELPAAAAASALEQAGPLAQEIMEAERVAPDREKISIWVTPRRIAIYISDLPLIQEAEEEAERGPAAAAAFDEEGKPTRAAEGFARAKGVQVEELEVREHQGREFVYAVRRRSGGKVVDLLPDICGRILAGISFPKTMRWDGGELRFSRPVRWLVTKYGEETIAFEAFGIQSGSLSSGHRFLGAAEVEIKSAGDYLETLRSEGVIVDQDARRHIILEGLEAESGKLSATWSDPGGKLEEVLYLVENPTVVSGSFKEEHLRLPDKVLITAMQSHQRYFPLITRDGELVNGFLYVMNSGPDSAPAVTEGNERILEGRIEDAEFSFDKDLDTGIESMVGALGEVVFHGRLGSLDAKAARLESLVGFFAGMLDLDEHVRRTAVVAAGLAKADLVSVMVQEFADLQGYMGSVYAEMEGYPSDVCQAVAEHYLPSAAGGELPSSIAAAVLAICDKVDNIVGAFSVNEMPTGSRDPYGLRRAALGIAAITQEWELKFDLWELLSEAHRLYIEQKADIDKGVVLTGEIADFIFDRTEQRLVEAGLPVEVLEAARDSRVRGLLELVSLARALDGFRLQPDFDDLHTAYFRCSKIAAKAQGEAADEIDPGIFTEAAEQELFKNLEDLQPRLLTLEAAGEYKAALVLASTIRPVVDRFFDEVMVMADDEAVKRNRLALVISVAQMLLRLGDPMKVAAAPKK